MAMEKTKTSDGKDHSREWMESAACANRDIDPRLFYPSSGERESKVRSRDAKAVCDQCSVRRQCLELAVQMDDAHGVWGGLNARERRRLTNEEPFTNLAA
ncbi:WhiB family transcriptional regulator [Streptomyces bobili]|uniref:WhiB family transcriptional regulator n=1 Tax=Streptomyces bobili TaxID=67280 RepID=UPI003816C8B0